MEIDGSTRLYFIVGDPIAQVKSPQAFNREFARRGLNAAMLPLNVPVANIDSCLSTLAGTPNVDGLVMTMPHKFAGYRHCTSMSDRAQFLETANVMRRSWNGSWHGDMVDGTGYMRALRTAQYELRGKHALLVGAGGAGTAIAAALLDEGVASLAIHDIDEHRRDALMAHLYSAGADNVRTGSRSATGMDLVINATPLGMRAGDPCPLDIASLSPTMFVGDVITVPVVSPLLKAASSIGCGTLTGSQMYQGVFELMVSFFWEDGR